MNPLFYALYGGTVLLLLVGAQLQVLKTALVCPDWPLCFGEFLPLYMTPAFYETLHRILAGLMAVGSLAWGIALWPRLKTKALLPLFITVVQSLLGWATYIYKLPTITTVLLLIFSLIFLAALDATRPLEFDSKLKEKWNPRLKDVVGLFLFMLVVQFVLGGILRKSSLLASCEATLSFWSCWEKQAEIPLAGSLSLVHRFLGLITTFTGLFVFAYLWRNLPRWNKAGLIGLVLMVGQLLLGLTMGRSSSRELVIWHFALALFAFCLLVFLLVRLRRYEWHFFEKPVPTYLNDLLDLFKPKLTILVVVTVFVGVLLAPMKLNIIYLLFALIGIWLQAAGSLSLNCYLERELDKHMDRTKDRPLPAGRLHPNVALYWGWGLVLLGTLVVALCANTLTAMLGLLAVLSYIYIYTPLKTRSPYALYAGAVPGAIPTLMGWTTMTATLSGMGSYLFGVLFLWQIPHFMAISMYRMRDYSNASFRTFSQTHSTKFLKVNIFIYSLALLGFGLLPFYWGWRGDGYLYSSLAIGVILTLVSFIAWFIKKENDLLIWARSYFWATLFYLPLQLGVLLVLR